MGVEIPSDSNLLPTSQTVLDYFYLISEVFEVGCGILLRLRNLHAQSFQLVVLLLDDRDPRRLKSKQRIIFLRQNCLVWD